MTFDPTSVEVTCVTVPKDHCVQVPWEYVNVCGYSYQFCKNYHIHTYTYTYYVHTTYILHTTYRISDHIVSFWTTFRRDKKLLYSIYSTQTINMTLFWWKHMWNIVFHHTLHIYALIDVQTTMNVGQVDSRVDSTLSKDFCPWYKTRWFLNQTSRLISRS